MSVYGFDVESGEWTFVDRDTGECHEGVAESVVETWVRMHRAQGWPYEVIRPDDSREVFDGGEDVREVFYDGE